jgi:hypothetical protein
MHYLLRAEIVVESKDTVFVLLDSSFTWSKHSNLAKVAAIWLS